MSEPLLVIVGPTASGKTAAAVNLAHALGGPDRVELIGADSVQIYQRLAIGSARPTAEELRGIRHHLIDLIPLDAPCDAARFVELADASLRDVRARGRIPIVVGGAGLYVRALIKGLAEGIPADPAVRGALQARIDAGGRDELARMHAELSAVDPTYAASIHPTDPIRVVRALEVFQVSGVPYSEHHRRHQQQPPRHEAWWVGIETPRDVLRARIAARAKAMLAGGWIDEVREILAEGFSPELKALRSVGYAEVVAHCTCGAPKREELDAQVSLSTSAFAKRQRTWFRGEGAVEWMPLEALATDDFHKSVVNFLSVGRKG